MKRILPIAAVILGARMLVGSFVLTTAKSESLLDYGLTPVALFLIVAGGYFLLKNYD
jgi:hypothetical protein